MDGRTALVVAHRLSTVARMNQLVVLDHGRIIEQRTHAELLQVQGTYARLWQHQSGGFLDDNAGTSPSDDANSKINGSSVF
jgi:ATP-binding cassette subfamily B protein